MHIPAAVTRLLACRSALTPEGAESPASSDIARIEHAVLALANSSDSAAHQSGTVTNFHSADSYNVRRRDLLLKPRNDPFYHPPTDLSNFRPGEIIRSRVTPGPIGFLVNSTTPLNLQHSHQLLYRTTDALGNPSAAVSTILIPFGAHFDQVVVYGSAYDSSDVDCSPSYVLQLAANMTGTDPIFLTALFEQGYVVSVADYEGLDAAFTAGIQAGQATLDSIRAVLGSGKVTGVSKEARYSYLGYSGGALAGEWALELQPLYAPELEIAGAALGGLTPNVTSVLNDVNNTTEFGYLPFASTNGLAAAYTNFSAYIDQELIPEKAEEFRSINYACTNDTNAKKNMNGQDLYSYFKDGAAVLNKPIPASVIKWGATMGLRSTPTVPMFVYKAIGDQVSPIEDTDILVDKYCADGATIRYQRNEYGDHITEAVIGSGEAFSYIFDIMNGISQQPGCSTKDVNITPVDLLLLGGFRAELLAILVALLALPLGPGIIGLGI